MIRLSKTLTRSCSSTAPFKLVVKTSSCNASSTKSEDVIEWNNVIKGAEKVVGYPTSFLSLRWLLNDEIANVATHIRKLIGTNHPLMNIAKTLLMRNDQPTYGLIVLLMSKAAGLKSKFSELEYDVISNILHSQRIIAEVTEMIKTSHLIHKGLININGNMNNISDLHFGNKLALLCGDYILSISFKEVARLKNFKVQEIISSAIRDLAESEILGLRNKQNQPIPSKPLSVQRDIAVPYEFGTKPLNTQTILGNMKSEWILRNVLGSGSLLGKCCQCALILANHEPHIQELGYSFGRNLALAWRASIEKDLLKEDTFDLASAPVMFHLEYDPSFYSNIEEAVSEDIDYNLIRESVMSGPGLAKTFQLQNEYSQKSLKILESFPDSDSKSALVNLIKLM